MSVGANDLALRQHVPVDRLQKFDRVGTLRQIQPGIERIERQGVMVSRSRIRAGPRIAGLLDIIVPKPFTAA